MKKRSIIAMALIAVGMVFILIGALKGQPASVMQKAIMICMECIGLG